MNIISFGSSEFAAPSLNALIEAGHTVSCVVTQPDRAKGRGLQFSSTAIKALAESQNLKIYQPERINERESIGFLKGFNADLFVVIAYGQILSEEVLAIPKIFSLNVHASLLPKYRGAAPINWAIIKGEKITGLTLIKMTPQMDAGPMIMQKASQIKDDDTALTLQESLSQDAAQVLVEAVKRIEHNDYKLEPQDETGISLAPKLKKEDGLISWDKSAEATYNLVRGCLGWPGAFTYYKGKLLKIFKASVCPLAVSRWPLPGEIIEITKNGILVSTGKDGLIIKELQMEGKRKMAIEDFIAGHRMCGGERFSKK